ncbi:alpha/beta fold hydrolase [Streptomyces chartreusis]|uniref:alpha/beta fold hydrolase n=1 Tax=Streptomyces chartreusis TaxID=1969 RepID=UPI003634CA3D
MRRRTALLSFTLAGLAPASAVLTSAGSASAASGSSTPAAAGTTSPADSQLTAPNLSIEADGVRYAYRRFGDAGSATPPVLFLPHFAANLDAWDPALIDPIAAKREVILLDNVGIGGSTGTTPRTPTEMAYGVLAFADAMGLKSVDLFGFSLGGFVAQEVTLIRPQLVRKLVLVGTGPQGGRNMHGFSPEILALATSDNPSPDTVVTLFFTDSKASTAAGHAYLQRIFTRTVDRDALVTSTARNAQIDAITTWGIPDASRLNRLAGIRQHTLVANGDNDILVPTPNTYLLAKHLPNATLKIYRDAGHGSLFQYPEDFAARVNAFLS